MPARASVGPRNYAELGPLGRALLPLYLGRPFPVVTALAAYFDDSWRDRVYVIAGYVGSVDMFDGLLTPAWRALIKNAPHPVKEYKQSDCRVGAGEFSDEKGWTDPERKAMTVEAVRIISQVCPYDYTLGVAGAVIFPKDHPPGATKRMIEEFGFDFCLHVVLMRSLMIAPNVLEDGEQIRIVCDEKKKFHHLMVDRFERVRDLLPEKDRKRFRIPIPEDSELVEPLQAADLLAHETYKELHSRINEPHRPVSGALARLVEARHHEGFCTEMEVLSRVFRRMKAGAEGPPEPASFIYMTGQEWRKPPQWMPSA